MMCLLEHMTATVSRTSSDPTPRELELLLDLSRHLAAGERIESVLEAVATDFGSLLPFDRMEYSEVQEDGQTMVVRWVRAVGGPVALEPGTVCLLPSPLPLPQNRTPYLIFDLPSYAMSKPQEHPVHRLAEAGYRASITCPLVVEGKVTAVAFFNTLQPDSWNERHLALVELIAGHLSMAAGRIRLTDELRTSNAELMRAQIARTEFVASVSHEIRTPLTAIVGLARTLSDSIDVLSREEISEFASLVAQQAGEVTGLVEDLLVATRVDAGSLRINFEQVDVARAITASIESLDPDFTPEVAGNAGMATADGLRLRQILRNLLTNAIRHGGPDVRVDHWRAGGDVFIAVSDDGDGVPPDRVDHIFEAFSLSEHGHAESVGLGLAVSRSLATAMAGEVFYDRRDGRTIMTVRVPAG